MATKNKEDRLTNSKLNVSSNVIIYILQSILSLIVRTVFIRKLGAELLGLDSLMINILSMLSIAEVGFSTAISYGLYKPLANKNVKKINAYMSLYKRIYRTIGTIIIITGLFLSIFLQKIIGSYSYQYLYIIYFMYLFNTASLYFISYKDVLLMADQKNYKVFKYNVTFNSLIYILQFIFILFTENYIIYLLIMILCKLANRILINCFITRYYPDINFNSKEKLSKEEMLSIKENVFGLFCFKIGDYVINCSDNIIISSLINIVTVGIYTNYLSIVSILKTIIKNIFNGVTASFGNLSVNNNKQAEKEVFEIMVFIGFIVSGFVTICLLNLINPFINLWIGSKYVTSMISMILICVNFYLMCNQIPLDTIKEAKGFYKKDRYIPIIQAIINIVISIVLGMKIGLNGVLLGTTISYLITIFWIKPLLLNKYIFETSSISYFLNQLKYIITLIVIYVISHNMLQWMKIPSNIGGLILSAIIVSIIFLLVVTIVFIHDKGYQFAISLIKNNNKGRN